MSVNAAAAVAAPVKMKVPNRQRQCRERQNTVPEIAPLDESEPFDVRPDVLEVFVILRRHDVSSGKLLLSCLSL